MLYRKKPTNIHQKNVIKELNEFSEEKIEILINWCWVNFYNRKTINKNYTSYGLKHIFEEARKGFYVTNAQFKAAMLEAGHKSNDESELNWNFKISEKSPALIGNFKKKTDIIKDLKYSEKILSEYQKTFDDYPDEISKKMLEEQKSKVKELTIEYNSQNLI